MLSRAYESSSCLGCLVFTIATIFWSRLPGWIEFVGEVVGVWWSDWSPFLVLLTPVSCVRFVAAEEDQWVAAEDGDGGSL